MPKLLRAMLCRRAIVDRETNTVSYIDGVEALAAAVLPAPLLPLTMVTSWKRNRVGEKFAIRAELVAPGPSVVLETPPVSVVLDKQVRHRQLFVIGGATIEVPGTYEFVVEIKTGTTWSSVVNLPVDIELAKKTSPARSS